MLKKTKKQILMVGLAGLVTAGSLFGGVSFSSVYAQEETAQEATEVNEETSASADATEAQTAEATENTDEAQSDTFTEEEATEEAKETETESTPVKQTEDNPLAGKEAAEEEKAEAEETKEDNIKAEVSDSSDNEKQITVNIMNDDSKYITGAKVFLYKADEAKVNSVIKDNEEYMTDYFVREEVKKSGSLEEAWQSEASGHSIKADPGYYVLFTNIENLKNLYIKTSENGNLQAGYYNYDKKAIEWKNVSNDTIYYYDTVYGRLETYVHPKIRVRDLYAKGGFIDSAKIALYRVVGDDLQEVYGERNSKGEYEYTIEYPADYVIKNTAISENYEKFDDVKFSVIRNADNGMAEFILDGKQSDVSLYSYDYEGNIIYDKPVYAGQELLEAYFEIIADFADQETVDVNFGAVFDETASSVGPANHSGYAAGVDLKLVRIGLEEYRNIVEEEVAKAVGEEGGSADFSFRRSYLGGTIVDRIVEEGTIVESWVTGAGTKTINLPVNSDSDIYVLADDSTIGWYKDKWKAFSIGHGGAVGYAMAEYDAEYDTWRSYEKWLWQGEDEKSVTISVPDFEVYAYPRIVIEDASGNSLVKNSVIELYKKDGDELTKVDLEIETEGFLEKDCLVGSLLYPGSYVLKCVSVPAGFEKFSDIEFSIIRNEKYGTAKLVLGDSAQNEELRVVGLESDGPTYGIAYWDDPSVIAIKLNGSSVGEASASASGNTAQAVAAQNTAGGAASANTSANAAGKVTAAKTGDRNFTSLYFIAAGAAVAAGVSAMVVRRKKEEN